MPTSKPCCVCRRWFEPDPRVGKRQRACFNPECQRERHRRSCAVVRDRDRRRERVDLLKRQVATLPAPGEAPDIPEVVGAPLRDERTAEMPVQIGKLLRLRRAGPRDETPSIRGLKRRKDAEVIENVEETRLTS